jgi:hypothetical protein
MFNYQNEALLDAFLALLALLVAVGVSFKTGHWWATSQAELEAAAIESKCYSKGALDAFVSKAGNDYVCFKQNMNTKKISKSLIVLETE